MNVIFQKLSFSKTISDTTFGNFIYPKNTNNKGDVRSSGRGVLHNLQAKNKGDILSIECPLLCE